MMRRYLSLSGFGFMLGFGRKSRPQSRPIDPALRGGLLAGTQSRPPQILAQKKLGAKKPAGLPNFGAALLAGLGEAACRGRQNSRNKG